MTEMLPKTPNILSTYLQADKNCHASLIEGGPDFWRGLMAGSLAGVGDGSFVFGRSFETDSGIWERHPQGDELIFLLEGAADLVLDLGQNGGLHTVELRVVGDYVRIPEGIWHRFHVVKPGKTLTIASGRGSEHRKE